MQLQVYNSALWDSMQSWVVLAGLSFIENLPHLKIITRWHSQSGSHVINFSCLQIIVLDHVLKWRDGVGGPWKCLDLSREAGQPTQMGLLQLLAEIKWTSPYLGKGGPDSQCYFMLTFFETSWVSSLFLLTFKDWLLFSPTQWLLGWLTVQLPAFWNPCTFRQEI